MKRLYIDYDGVIRDTMTVSYEMMRNKNIDISNRSVVINFFENIDWENLINISIELNRAYYYINKLIEEGNFDVSILTKINSLKEMSAKIYDIRKYAKDAKIICVPNNINKNDAVNANGAILIDDYSGNLKSWEDSGGIAVKYSNKLDKNYLTIDSLKVFISDDFSRKLVKNSLK